MKSKADAPIAVYKGEGVQKRCWRFGPLSNGWIVLSM
jgi:hypothetical protein